MTSTVTTSRRPFSTSTVTDAVRTLRLDMQPQSAFPSVADLVGSARQELDQFGQPVAKAPSADEARIAARLAAQPHLRTMRHTLADLARVVDSAPELGVQITALERNLFGKTAADFRQHAADFRADGLVGPAAAFTGDQLYVRDERTGTGRRLQSPWADVDWMRNKETRHTKLRLQPKQATPAEQREAMRRMAAIGVSDRAKGLPPPAPRSSQGAAPMMEAQTASGTARSAGRAGGIAASGVFPDTRHQAGYTGRLSDLGRHQRSLRPANSHTWGAPY